MTAFFTERFGRQRYLTASILIFIVASFFCGTSHSLTELVVWRIIQGAGGAALLSTAQATLRQIFPREQQGMVQAIFLLGIIVAPTLGPTLGGWITDNYSWRWCFFINVPIGIVSAFLVSTFLKDPPDQRRRRGQVDWLGIGLLTVGIGSLQYVLEEGNAKDWFSDKWIVRLRHRGRRLPGHAWSGGSCRPATSTRSSTSGCSRTGSWRPRSSSSSRSASGSMAASSSSRCSPRASALHPHGDRPGADAGRASPPRSPRSSAARCSTAPARGGSAGPDRASAWRSSWCRCGTWVT